METRPVPSNPAYEISESGDVRMIGKTAWLRPCRLQRGGYLAVSLQANGKGHTRVVHKLVAEAFLPPRPSHNYQIAHRDGDKTNNHHSNLRWATRAENERDKLAHGTSNRGERSGTAKLSNRDAELVRDLCRMAPRGIQKRLAEYFQVTGGTISNIASGKRHINGPHA